MFLHLREHETKKSSVNSKVKGIKRGEKTEMRKRMRIKGLYQKSVMVVLSLEFDLFDRVLSYFLEGL